MEKAEKIIEIEQKKEINLSDLNGKKLNRTINVNRKSKIEELKRKINNDDYLNEAINKLANSLTVGLMK